MVHPQQLGAQEGLISLARLGNLSTEHFALLGLDISSEVN